MDDWKQDLERLFADKQAAEERRQDALAAQSTAIERWIVAVVVPALNEVKAELEKYGRRVTVSNSAESASLTVHVNDGEEFGYQIRTLRSETSARPQPSIRFRGRDGEMCRAEGVFRDGPQDYDITSISKSEIIRHVVGQYKSHQS